MRALSIGSGPGLKPLFCPLLFPRHEGRGFYRPPLRGASLEEREPEGWDTCVSKGFPQGLKPAESSTRNGTTEVVP